LWKDLEAEIQELILINCGVLNISKRSITPRDQETYAYKSSKVMESLKLDYRCLSRKEELSNFPQFDIDFATLDRTGGFLYLPPIREYLIKSLRQAKVTIKENATIESIDYRDDDISLQIDNEAFTARKLIITAGLGTNKVLSKIKPSISPLPITFDKPKEIKYIIPKDSKMYIPDKLPVFAYLDVGIYGHPWYINKTRGIKVGYYNPPGVKPVKSRISNIQSFLDICMPALKEYEIKNVKDVDQCSYDMTPDGDFILGPLPALENVLIASGWNGTGFKFAPIVGKLVSDLALGTTKQYNSAIYNRFSPDRFY
jgi:sarcosine oxidase/N-methyl-L-tryptophan oxidase